MGPWDAMCHLITKGDVNCVQFERTGKTFPVTESDESAFSEPPANNKKAEKDISVYRWRKTSCPGSHSAPISHLPWHWQIGHPNAWTNIWCALTGYPHCWFRLRRTSSMPDQTGQDLRVIVWGPCHTNPWSERGFLLGHGYGCDGVVRPDQLDRLVNHLWPNQSQGGSAFTKRRPLCKLPLDSNLMFVWQFKHSSEGNWSRQPLLPRLPRGSPLALDWIPKRLASASKGMAPPREKPNKGKSASETLKLKVKTSAKEQPQRSFGDLSWLQGRSRVHCF